MPFNLLTAYGRAQAYAHSAEGAAQVRLLEQAEDALAEQIQETTSSTLEKPIADLFYYADEMRELLQDTAHDASVKRFKKKLTIKQRESLARILRKRSKQEEEVLNNITRIELELEKLKEIFKIL